LLRCNRLQAPLAPHHPFRYSSIRLLHLLLLWWIQPGLWPGFFLPRGTTRAGRDRRRSGRTRSAALGQSSQATRFAQQSLTQGREGPTIEGFSAAAFAWVSRLP